MTPAAPVPLEPVDPAAVLPDDLLAAFRERAARTDRDNAFFDEDLEDLRRIGYLRLLVPRELGGAGASVLDATRLQRRLAAAAPATALGISMHLVVTGAARRALGAGLASGRRILEQAVAGELFAFGISEAGNDAMLFDAATTAEPRGGGAYALTGTKIFTSLSPAWTRLVAHATVADEGEGQSLVFGVLRRGDGIEVGDDWDAHGMRATQSRSTRLTAAPLAAADVVTHTPVGPNADPFVVGVFGCFELLLASVYTGLAERAVGLAVEEARARRPGMSGVRPADDPDVRRRLASAAIGVDGSVLQIERLAADLDALGSTVVVPGAVDHGPRWFLQLSGVKARATETAIGAVDQALRASGGRHFSRDSELERLSRDVRASLYQPSSEDSVRASYARALLGEVGSER